jgi:dihydroorotate dehydrogenase (NAD+) catalytic subunit
MLEREFLGSQYKNPLILASGILGMSKEILKRVALNGAGGLTIKSISWEPREGHHNPTILGWEHGMINAVGYSNPGWEEAKKEFSDLSDIPAPVIGSCVANDAEGFGKMVKAFDSLEFAAIELPLSCPHTPGFGLLAGQGTPEATTEITKAARKATKKPLIVKISPSVPNLGEVAKAAEKAGANAINMGNTLGPGMRA